MQTMTSQLMQVRFWTLARCTRYVSVSDFRKDKIDRIIPHSSHMLPSKATSSVNGEQVRVDIKEIDRHDNLYNRNSVASSANHP